MRTVFFVGWTLMAASLGAIVAVWIDLKWTPFPTSLAEWRQAIAALNFFPADAQEWKTEVQWAGWAQTLGSIAAILAGFGLARRAEKARAAADSARDQQLISNAMASVKTELWLSWGSIESFLETYLAPENRERLRQQTLHVEPFPFPVFHRVAEHIGALPKESDRRAILDSLNGFRAIVTVTTAMNQTSRNYITALESRELWRERSERKQTPHSQRELEQAEQMIQHYRAQHDDLRAFLVAHHQALAEHIAEVQAISTRPDDVI